MDYIWNACKKCGNVIPNRVTIDNKVRTINKRKYCLKCSPFNYHNTKKLCDEIVISKDFPLYYKCKCGETNKSMFYGKKHNICMNCHKAYVLAKGQEKRNNAILYKGSKCFICGYDKYNGALEFHHLDPSKKDKNFSTMRSWKLDKIINEIDDCMLVCSCCHREIHAGMHNETLRKYKK